MHQMGEYSVAGASAGWYPQPDGRQRYWDGQRWTEHFAPGAAGMRGASSASATQALPTTRALSGGSGTPRRKPWAALALAAASGTAGLIIGAALPGGASTTQSFANLPLAPPTVTQTVSTPGPTVTEPGPTVTSPGPTVTTTATPAPAPTVTKTVTAQATKPQPLVGGGAAADVYYKNCTAARAAGVTPLRRGDPGYGPHLDRDNDGRACE